MGEIFTGHAGDTDCPVAPWGAFPMPGYDVFAPAPPPGAAETVKALPRTASSPNVILMAKNLFTGYFSFLACCQGVLPQSSLHGDVTLTAIS